MSEDETLQKLRAQGNKSFRNNNFPEAIHSYKKGLKIDEKNPQLNNNIAQAYLAVCDFVNAETHAVVAIENCHDSAKGYFRAAKASVGQGNKLKALRYLKEGIENCSDTKDLKEYQQKLVKEEIIWRMEMSNNGEITEDIPDLVSDSDSDDAGVSTDKLRSRSTSRMASTSTVDSHKLVNVSPRSVSMSRTSPVRKTNKKSKKKKGPIQQEDIANDPTLLLFESIKKEQGIPHVQPEQLWATKRKKLNLLLKEGSEVMANGLSRKAVEKYKTALDMILEHSLEIYKLKEIDFIVLKYALCIGWIELADYGDIAKAVEYLMDIEETRASKFPAVFYGLGSAYYKLNRYKVATEHLEKGLLFLSREVKFEVQSWPGTNNVIPETTRSGLEDVLKELLKTCKTYHEPDAICRYSKCLSLSSHIIPSEYIFFSDPDFCGFVVVICEEKCRIEYHLGCWKDYKETSTSDGIGKLSDKDFIGRLCPTTDCINQLNERSVIVKIEIVGDDTTIKASIEAPKTEFVKETKKMKKKKPEKIPDVSSQDKPKVKIRSKIKRSVSETIQPSPQPDLQQTNSAEELDIRLEKLRLLRNINFGFTDDNWNPREMFYGRQDIQELDHFLSPEYIEESDENRGKKDFIFSYFYEFIKNEGPQKVKDVERKWANEAGDFQGIDELLKSTNSSICMFLIQSYRFAMIDDYICLAEQLFETYNMAKTELVESLSFTLTKPVNSLSPSHTTNPNIDSEVINVPTTKDNSNQQVINTIEGNCEVNKETSDLNITHTDSNIILTGNDNTIEENCEVNKQISDLNISLTGDGENFHGHIENICEDKNNEDDENVDDPDIDISEDQAIIPDSNQALESSSDKQPIKFDLEDEDIKICSENQTVSDSEDDIKSMSESEDIKSESKGQASNSGSEDNPIKSKSPDISRSESVTSEEEKNEPFYDSEGEVNDNSDISINDEIGKILKKNTPQEEIDSGLNPDAGVFKSPEEIAQDKIDKTEIFDLHLEEKVGHEFSESNTAVKKIDQEVTTIPALPREGISSLNMDYKRLRWSLNDGHIYAPLHFIPHSVVMPHQQSPVPCSGQYMSSVLNPYAIHQTPLFSYHFHSGYNGMAYLPIRLRPQHYALPFPHERVNVQSKECSKRMECNDMTTQTDKNYDEEIGNFKSVISKLEQDLEKEKETNDIAKVLADAQLEEKNKKIQELELELKKEKENKEEQIAFLKEKLKGNETKFKTEKTKLLQDLEKAKSENNANEIIRNLISTSGQRVKSLEDEINLYKKLVLMLKEETKKLKISTCRQKCVEILEALNRGEKYLSYFSTTNKTEFANAIQKWKTYFTALTEHEAKFQVDLKLMNKEVGGITYQDLINKEWVEPPPEPECPLSIIEQIACKLLEEKGDTLQVTTAQKDNVSLNKNKTDRPNTPNIVTENKMSQNVDVLNKDNIEVREKPGVGKDAEDKNQKSEQAKATYNPAGAPLFQYPLAVSSGTGFSYMQPTPYFYNSKQYIGSSMPLPFGQQVSPLMMQQSVRSPVLVHSGFVSSENVQEIPSSNVTETKSKIESLMSEQNAVWSGTLQPSKDSSMPTEKDFSNRSFLEKKKSPSSGLTPIEVKKPVPPSVGSTVVKPATKLAVQVPAANTVASSFEQKPGITLSVKQKTGSSYQKLMAHLHKNFPTKTEEELAACIAIVRERNNNSLTGISVPKIISMVDKELKEKASKKQGSMGLDKFGGAAWGGVHHETTSNWSKPKENKENDCVICFDPLDKDNTTTLQCKHTFHTKCIRQWVHNESVCPMCREFTKLVDEFPPLKN